LKTNAIFVFMCGTLLLGAHGCCGAAGHPAHSPSDAAVLAIAQRELVVLPVFTSMDSSGFPVSSRNVVCAAHAHWSAFPLAAVKGRPMFVVPGDAELHDRPQERDWTCMYSTTNRFTPNLIDGTVELRAGDRVVFGGFRASEASRDPIEHMGRCPEILLGRVLSPQISVDSTSIVEIEVPWGDYHGFSGGPAAIVDENGQLRVWGVVVRVGWVWNPLRSFCRRSVLKAARMPQGVLDKIQKAEFLNPAEARHTNATSGRLTRHQRRQSEHRAGSRRD
jgi:hypothetical protein